MKRSVWLSVLAVTMVSGLSNASAMVATWDFPNQLTLLPQIFAGSSHSALDAGGGEGGQSAFYREPEGSLHILPNSEVSRLSFASFGDGVLLLEGTRNHGWGMGVSSTGGLAVMGGYVTRDNVEVCLYYLRRITDARADPSYDLDYGPMAQPDNTIGIRICVGL